MKNIPDWEKLHLIQQHNGHDDLMMSSIWALYVLKIDLIENYYDVKQFANDKLGNQQPLFITATEYISENDLELRQFINELDEKFKTSNNKYEISFNQLEQNIQESQAELMQHFKLSQGLTINENSVSPSDMRRN